MGPLELPLVHGVPRGPVVHGVLREPVVHGALRGPVVHGAPRGPVVMGLPGDAWSRKSPVLRLYDHFMLRTYCAKYAINCFYILITVLPALYS